MPTSLENMDDETRDGLAELARKLSSDPKTRRGFQQLLKANDPNLPIPELDTEARVLTAIKPYAEKLALLEQKEIERTATANINAKRAALRDKGYSQEKIDSIEKLMIEKQIPSHDTAAQFFEMQNKTAIPAPSVIHQVQMPVKGDDIKKAGGIGKWARSEAHAAIDDIRSGRVKLGSDGTYH